MGERYDVQVTLGDGIFPLTALAEGKNATALALVRTGAGERPPATIRPAELNGPWRTTLCCARRHRPGCRPSSRT